MACDVTNQSKLRAARFPKSRLSGRGVVRIVVLDAKERR